MLPYLDIHTHSLDAGPSAIINLPFGADIPAEGAFSMGIHPWDTGSASADDIALLARLAESDRIVAMGECGIDALHGAPIERQKEIFLKQARISESLRKPMIIHAVRAHAIIADLRRSLKPSQSWIIHGFRGKPQLARQLLAAGCDISLGERFNPDVPPIMPKDRLYAETDCSTMPIERIRAMIGLS